jgi:hypothetical protein
MLFFQNRENLQYVPHGFQNVNEQVTLSRLEILISCQPMLKLYVVLHRGRKHVLAVFQLSLGFMKFCISLLISGFYITFGGPGVALKMIFIYKN